MNSSVILVIGLSVTSLISISVVRYLSSPLRKQLFELCGNSDRAEFWTVFSNATLMLVPIIFAMQFEIFPEASVPPIFAIVGQIKWGVSGLVFSMLMLAWILSRIIRRHTATNVPAQASTNKRQEL